MRKILLTLILAASLAFPVNAYASETDLSPVTEASDNSTYTSTDADDSATIVDDGYSVDSSVDNASDVDTNEGALDIENGQAVFTTYMGQGVNRFELFYFKNYDNSIMPSLVFEYGGNSYEASYGNVNSDSPVTIRKGEDITVNKENGEGNVSLSMLAVYFDTKKTQQTDGGSANVTVNADIGTSNCIIIASTEMPSMWRTIADGDEARQPLLNVNDSKFVLRYALGAESQLAETDITPLLMETGDANVTPETQAPPEPDRQGARMRLILFCVVIFLAVAGLLMLRSKKAKKAIAEAKNEKKKANRKKKEEMVRENDRLSGALRAYEEEYSDKDYYEKNIDDEIVDADRAGAEGMSQIPQDKFASYSTGIKEALYTVGPETEIDDPELKAKRDALIKRNEEAEAGNRITLPVGQPDSDAPTPGVSEKRTIVISDDDGDLPEKEEDDAASEVKELSSELKKEAKKKAVSDPEVKAARMPKKSRSSTSITKRSDDIAERKIIDDKDAEKIKPTRKTGAVAKPIRKSQDKVTETNEKRSAKEGSKKIKQTSSSRKTTTTSAASKKAANKNIRPRKTATSAITEEKDNITEKKQLATAAISNVKKASAQPSRKTSTKKSVLKPQSRKMGPGSTVHINKSGTSGIKRNASATRRPQSKQKQSIVL